VTSQTRFGNQSDRPIRKDRLLIVGLIVVAAIVIPLLLRSGGAKREDDSVVVVSDGQTVGTTGTTTVTAPTASGTPGDVDSVVKAILPTSSGSTTSPSPSSAATPATSKPAATAPVSAVAATPSNASILSHTVKQGETLQSIATSMGVSVRDLRADNQIYGTAAPAAGRVLYAAKSGLVHGIKSGQTLTDISATYGVSVDAITSANGISSTSTIFAGARLVIPGASSAFWDTVTTLSRGSTAQFIWPLQGTVVSSFGWRQHPVLDMRHHHDGIDLDVPEGTTVYASAGGEVYFYGEQPGYGNVLILEHAGGFYTLYGHLKSSLANKGQYVEKGQRVAISGNTGISSGPHLHFELRNGEFPVDPVSFLP
jgi:murein DD-endopeptidase MepM/ murein hydrolase activator NlpD